MNSSSLREPLLAVAIVAAIALLGHLQPTMSFAPEDGGDIAFLQASAAQAAGRCARAPLN